MHAKGKFQVFVEKTEDGWESEGGEWPGCLIGQASVHEYQIDPDVPAGLTVLALVPEKLTIRQVLITTMMVIIYVNHCYALGDTKKISILPLGSSINVSNEKLKNNMHV